MWSETSWAREIAALVAIAVEARSREEYRVAVLGRLQAVIGFDSAVFASPSSASLATLNKTAAMRRTYLSSRKRYAPDLALFTRAALLRGGAAMDDDVMPARDRERLAFCDEIMRPQGVTSILVGCPSVRGAWPSRMFLARHGHASPFGDRHRERLGRLLPVLSLGDGVDRRSPLARPGRESSVARPGDVEWGALTPRELDLLDFVARGWRNAEIALALGTSPFTVRNQLAGVFRKCGATTRAELVRVAVDGGFVKPA